MHFIFLTDLLLCGLLFSFNFLFSICFLLILAFISEPKIFMFRISAHFLSYQMATRLWPVGRNQLWIAICRHLMILLDSTFVLRHSQHIPLWRTVARDDLLASVYVFFQPGTLVPGTRLAPQTSHISLVTSGPVLRLPIRTIFGGYQRLSSSDRTLRITFSLV